MSSQYSASHGFSPLFSNAAPDHAAAPDQAVDQPTSEQKRSTEKRSQPDGDHHLKFIDLDDLPPSER